MKILVIDLEATCADDDSLPTELMETIEVGAVWVAESGKIVDQFQSFVHPIERPHLTLFCSLLTGIKQSDIDIAATWPTVAADLFAFVRHHQEESSYWGSWGNFDCRQIERDCIRHKIANPLLHLPHENLKANFAKLRKIKQVGMSTALKISGFALQGEHHRALSDALNIARLIPVSCR